MAIDIVQVCSAASTFSFTTADDSLTATFPSAVTQGNMILVLLAEDNQGLISSISINSVTDTVSNGYTVSYQNWQPGSAGCGSAFAYVLNAVGGSDTVTVSLHLVAAIGTQSARFGVLCIELSGVPPFSTIFSTDTYSVFGSAGNTPVPVTISDSLGNTVTVTFGGTQGSGGPGITANLNLFDLVGGGVNFLCAWCVNQVGTNVPTADHGYSFTLSENVTPGPGFHFFTPGLPFAIVQQPQIFAVN